MVRLRGGCGGVKGSLPAREDHGRGRPSILAIVRARTQGGRRGVLLGNLCLYLRRLRLRLLRLLLLLQVLNSSL